MREKLYVFDNQDNLLTVTYNYITAEFEETVEKPESLTIEFPMTDEDAEHFVGGNQVAFRDLKGNFRLFLIREVDDQDGEATEKIIECMPAMQELTDVMVEEKRPQDRTAEYVLEIILENSRWQAGSVAELGKFSTSFYFNDAYESLGELIEIWGGEVVDRIEIDKNKISGRYIDIVHRKGENNGKRFEIGKDIKNIIRTVLYYPKTALYGKGASLELEDDEGEATGGHSRKITFRDVEWKKSDGDPVDKPAGQEWVGDPEAIKKHGIPNQKTGELNHRFGMFEDNDEEDPETLLQKTWDAVQDEKDPRAQYEMDIETFYGVADYEHEQVFLGDTGIARDKSIKPMILVESRVMSLKYDIGNPENGEVNLGNILDLSESNTDIDWVIDKVKDNAGNWDSGGGPITDEKFPDKKPQVPENVKVDGLYQTIMLSWDFDSAFYIASYEVYASQTKGFIPDSTNLVFRGKTGGYVHEAENNDMWYFRIRAVNTHGTASDYTDEYSAMTAKINFDDIDDENIPDFIEHSIYKGDTAPSPDEYKYWIDTSDKPSLLKYWDEASETWEALSPTNPGDLGAVDLQDYQNKINEIVSDIADKAGLEYVDGQLRDKVSQKDYEAERQAILDELADKVGAEWVNGQLVSKVDKKTYDDRMEEVGKEIADKADFEWVDGKLTDKADQTELNSVKDDLASKVDGEWVDGKLKSKADKDTTYTMEQVDNALNNKVSSAEYKTDKDGFVERFNQNESSISQNEKEIRTKVDSKEYEALENTVNTNTTNITQNAKEIESKATQENLDTVTGKVNENESSIKQNAEEITSKVSQSDYKTDQANNVTRFEDNESAITQNAKEISSKVEQTEYDADINGNDGLKQQVTKAQTDITQNAKEISSKASQEELDSTNQSVKDNASEISQNAKEIASKVSQTEYNDLSDDVSQNTSSITQNAKDITSKVDATTYKEDKDGIITDIKSNTSSIEQNAKEISSKVDETYVEGAIDDVDIGGTNLIPYSNDFSNYKGYKNTEREIEEGYIVEEWGTDNATRLKFFRESEVIALYTTPQITGKKATTITFSYWLKNVGVNPLAVSYNGLRSIKGTSKQIVQPNEEGRIIVTGTMRENYDWFQHQFRPVNIGDEIEFAIWQSQLEYGNKATAYSKAPGDIQDQIDDTNEVVKTQGTEIKQNAEEISSKASQSSVDTIGGKVSDNESEIKQQAQLIEQRVTKTDYKKDQDDVISDLESHETRITQTEKDITSKVDSTTYKSDKDSLEKDIKNNTSEITQNAKTITSKVDATTYEQDKNGMVSDIKENTSNIEQNAKAITSKVEQKDIDGAIDGVEIGGRNLIKDSSFYELKPKDTSYNYASINLTNTLEKNTEYIVSADVEITKGDASEISILQRKGNNDSNGSVGRAPIKKGKISKTFTTSNNDTNRLLFYAGVSGSTNGIGVIFTNVQLEKGNKATAWRPAFEDAENEINSVREYASEIEQTAKGIKSEVTALEKDVSANKTSISDAKSDIKQQADQITARVTKTTHKADLDSLNTKVSEAESSITQNAESITAKVSKNGVISSINQTAETVTIDASKLNVKGDLNVVDGNLRIQNSVITNEMVAGNAKIDFAKIANVKVTNAMIDNVSASKVNAKTLSSITGNLGTVYVDGDMPEFLYSNAIDTNPYTRGVNIYIRPTADGEVRATETGTRDKYVAMKASSFNAPFGENAHILTDNELRIQNYGQSGVWRDVRARRYYGSGFITNSTNAYIGADSELRVVNKGLGDIFRDVRASSFYGTQLSLRASSNATHLYVRPAGNGEVRVTSRSSTSNYRPIRASSFPTGTSLRENKTDIEIFDDDVLSQIKKSNTYTYRLKDDASNPQKQLGLMVDETPRLLHGETGDSMELYALTTYVYRGVQQLADENEHLRKESESRHERIAQLEKMMHEFMGGNK